MKRQNFIERPRCKVDGCNSLARKVNKAKDGTWSYGKECPKHNGIRYGMAAGFGNRGGKRYLKKKLGNKPCIICGWHETSCDLHRIIYGKDGGLYKTNNVVFLCPNCHRLVHVGKIILSVELFKKNLAQQSESAKGNYVGNRKRYSGFVTRADGTSGFVTRR